MRDETVDAFIVGQPGQPFEFEEDKKFVKLTCAFWGAFLRQLKIDDGKARLVLYFAHKSSLLKPNSDNIVEADNKELMEILAISKPTLLKWLNDLEELKIIKRLRPKLPYYRVAPNMIYRGEVKKYYQRHGDEIS